MKFPTALWGSTQARFAAYSPAEEPSPYASLVFVFHDQKLVLANISGRGWTIPGGRVEAGESSQAAAEREAFEECGAVLSLVERVGTYELTTGSGEPARHVALFIAEAADLLPLPALSEAVAVDHVSLAQLPKRYYMWDPLIEAVCSYACSIGRERGWIS